MTEAVPTLAEMTPEWLTQRLRENGYDVTVAAVKTGPIGTGQVGATYRLNLTFAGLANGAPPTLVAKLPSNDCLSKVTGKSHMTYIRESRFYQLFAGKRAMAVPDHLFIAFVWALPQTRGTWIRTVIEGRFLALKRSDSRKI